MSFKDRAAERLKATAPKLSRAQVDYLEALFIDCGMNTAQRRGYIRSRVDRDITYLDDLTGPEASALINSLKAARKP